ncbi:hypothetical protein [Lactobacillus phage PMBT4]|nr:hypothetical protein [Lactobacillus phage PMBT4]
MNGFNDYLVARFNSGIKVCKAPFASLAKPGDLVEVKGTYGKGTVLATESASKSNPILGLIEKINFPEEGAYNVTAIYSKKEIEWKEEEK